MTITPLEMERNIEFNLQEQISNWVRHLKTEPSITESDSEELKSHLLDLIDELKEVGLDEEEAFWVASKRMGSSFEWAADYSEGNKPLIQLRRSLFILAGVLAYFLLFFLIKSSSKLLFIVLLLKKTDGYLAVNWVSKYLIGAHFAFIFFVVSIYFLEKKTVSFIEDIKLKPSHTLLLLFTTVIFGITDTCFFPVAKNLMGQDYSLRGQLIHVFLYFDFSFPFLICVSFIIMYFKYYKKAKF
jgi:hypothetical protein